MSYREAAYKQVLMGVSEQVPTERLDGQLTEQVNMSSDIVFGLRRRSPMKFVYPTNRAWNFNDVAVYNTRVLGKLQFLVVDVSDGVINVFDSSGTLEQQFTSGYLVASSRAAIRFATVGSNVFIANTEVFPSEELASEVTGYPDPSKCGYWQSVSSAFSKTYDVTVTDINAGTQYTYEYVTPTGATASDAALAATDYIANDLAAKLVAGIGGWANIVQKGSVISIKADRPISVTSNSGITYARSSRVQVVPLVDELPATLDDMLNNFIMAVGSGITATYYRWRASTQSWVEDAAWSTGKHPTDMPVMMRPTDAGDSWEYLSPEYARRSSGNEDTNPTPAFVYTGITGLGAFQGRLVILSQESVCMSDTTNPLRFYRSTTESIVASDCIEAAGSDSDGSSYTHAVVFNKDLVCIGPTVQAVVPGSQAVTPSNVVVAVMSRYKFTLFAKPVVTGRSMYVGATRGDGYCALWEVVPSDYVDSQIVANDVTSHLPTYCAGYFYLLAASSTSSITVAAASDNPDTLLVQEYNYSGNDKRQSAWHKWVLPANIIHAEFDGDVLYLILNKNGTGYFGSIDLRSGSGAASAHLPRIDAYVEVTANAASKVTVSAAAWSAMQAAPLAFKLTGEGSYLPQSVGSIVYNSDETVTVGLNGAEEGDKYALGTRYTSSFTLSPPTIRDGNGDVVRMYRSDLQRYRVQWQNTGTFNYSLSDRYRVLPDVEVSPVTFGDPGLTIGKPMVANGRVIVPCRLDMPTVSARFYTDDVYDLNPVLIEYGYRYTQTRGQR